MSEVVLVTGATGFVGSALVERLAAQGHRVVCPVRPGGEMPPRLQGQTRVSAVVTPMDDAAQLATALAGERPERVYHLAAAGVRADDRGSAALLAGNVNITMALLQAATDWPLQCFVHVGSCAEYGLGCGQPVAEDAPLLPASAYGAAKAAASMLALGFGAAWGLPLVLVRPFGTFGPGEAPQRLLPYLMARLGLGLPAELTPGDQVRDLMWIDDMAAAVQLAGTSGLASGSVWNLCTGQGRTIREIGETLADKMGAPRSLLRWGAVAHRDDEPRVLVGDPSRFWAATGWRPATDFNTALEHLVSGATADRTAHARV